MNKSFPEWIHEHRHLIGVLAFLGIVAYGFSAFNFIIVADDWHRSFRERFELPVAAAVGRGVGSAIRYLAYDNRVARGATLFAGLSMVMMASLWLSGLYGAKTRSEKLVFASLVMFHPVLAIHFMFFSHHLIVGVGFLLCAVFVLLVERVAAHYRGSGLGIRERLWWALAVLVFAVALNIRQEFFMVAAAFLAGAAIRHFLDAGAGQARLRSLVGTGKVYGSACIAALGLYYVLVKAGHWWFETDFYKGGDYAWWSNLVSSGEDLRMTFGRTGALLTQFLFQQQPLWPLAVKVCFLGAVGLFLVGAFRSLRGYGQGGLAWGRNAGIVLGGVAALLVIPWSLALLLKTEHTFRYTALLGLVPVYAIIYAGALGSLSGWLRRTGFVLAGLTIASFIFFQNVGSMAIYATNRRDLAVAERMLTRIETHPRFSSLSRYPSYEVTLIGSLEHDRRKDIPFSYNTGGPMGLCPVSSGIFHRPLFRFEHLMRYVDYPSSRRTFRYYWKPKDIRRALASLPAPRRAAIYGALHDSRSWPDHESIQFFENRVFVLLDRSPWMLNRFREWRAEAQRQGGKNPILSRAQPIKR